MTSETPTTPPEMRVNACKYCGESFTPTRDWQDFCDDACRFNYHNKRKRRNEKGPLETGLGLRKNTDAHNYISIRPGTKLYNIARALYQGQRLDCFMAVREFHDYTLRSTISELAHRYGVEIIRTPKTVLGHAGSMVHCVEYHTSENGIERLGELLQ